MTIDLTEQAKKELIKLLESKDSEKPLRIYVAGFGWGGPTFGIALDEHKEGDAETKIDDLTFLVEKDLTESFNNFKIDYSDNWLRRGFTVIPDGIDASC